MNQFDIAQAFIEQCGQTSQVGQLAAVFQQALQTLGFRYFACWSHVDPLRPPRRAVMLHNYPQEWVHCFIELEFHEIDPVFHYANRTLLPFFWNSDLFRAELTLPQQDILAEAARFGVTDGYTVPIHSPSSSGSLQASCSVVPDSVALERCSYSAVQLMACYLHEAASRSLKAKDTGTEQRGLSRRERQCLELAAQGKSDWVVGQILGISESTVHNHIESAKRRLGVATRVQAIVFALASRQISFGDVIRAEIPEPADSAKLRTKR